MDRDTAIGGPGKRFPATRLSVVESLQSDDDGTRLRAGERLVELYWKPLYTYLRVRWTPTNEDAKDLIQGFLTVAFERETLASFDPQQGSFRTFLRVLLDRYVANEHKSQRRHKRGGGQIALDFDEAEAELARLATDGVSPEDLLHREWVRSLFGASLERLQAELIQSGRAQQYQVFAAFDLADAADRPSYREIGAQLGVAETTVTNNLAAARRRFRSIVLTTLREVTTSEAEFRAEARLVLGVEV